MQGKKIHGFTIKHLLGTGGMADVYYAENSLKKTAAVKVLKQKFSEEPSIRDRFKKEADVMVGLDHENIRTVKDRVELEGRPAILMEYLDGQSLRERLLDGPPINDTQLKDWFRQVVEGLKHAHSKGVTHRDIKPSNIFITKKGKIKILDFGIAKVKGSVTNTMTGQTLGTVMYMSPEQVEDPKRVEAPTDIYSLGVTFYHLLTRNPPYDATTDSAFKIQFQIVQDDLDLNKIPSHWRSVIAGCLKKDPAKRKINDFGTRMEDAEEIEDGTIVDIPAPKSRPKVPPKSSTKSVSELPSKKKNYVMYGLGLLLLFVLGGAGFYFSGLNDKPSIRVYQDDSSGKYGFEDDGGNKIITARYDTAMPFVGDKAKVTIADSVYYINQSGKIIEVLKPGKNEIQEQMAWEKAKKEDSKESYTAYLEIYPVGKFANEAQRKLDNKKQEEAAAALQRQNQIALDKKTQAASIAAQQEAERLAAARRAFAQKEADRKRREEEEAARKRQQENAGVRGRLSNDLSGRSVISSPGAITDFYSSKGTVKLKICIKSDGSVLSVIPIKAGTTNDSESLYKLAKKNAEQFKFERSNSSMQCVSIFYVFK